MRSGLHSRGSGGHQHGGTDQPVTGRVDFTGCGVGAVMGVVGLPGVIGVVGTPSSPPAQTTDASSTFWIPSTLISMAVTFTAPSSVLTCLFSVTETTPGTPTTVFAGAATSSFLPARNT